MAGTRTATLIEVGLWLRVNHPSGFFAGWDSAWRQQHLSGGSVSRADEVFWQHDVHVGYRWPRRHAEVRVGVLNLTDSDYRLDPLNLMAEPARRRTFHASLRLNF
jgi:outer membrane receptor protein involved in Fe transport